MKARDARLLSDAEELLSARLVKVEEALLETEKKGSEPKKMRKKEEKEEVVKKVVRQVPILMEDGRRVVQKKTTKNGDSGVPNLSADFQKDINDFVQMRDGRTSNGNGFTKRIFFQSTEEIEEVTSRSRRGPSRGWNDKEEEDSREDEEEKQSRRSLPPEAGVRAILSLLDSFMHHLDIDIC